MPKAITITVMLPDEIAAEYEVASDPLRHAVKGEEYFDGSQVREWEGRRPSCNIYLILRKIPKPEWPASLAGAKMPWICGDKNGLWYAYSNEPTRKDCFWSDVRGHHTELPREFYPDLPVSTADNWRTMKIANPKLER